MSKRILTKNCPAISVIIPLYNVEKYVGECFDSLLAQTFQDFEVIVVDDCSTDNSVAIVESYKEKFGGRLKLIKTLKNSGNAGLPRNKGIALSRGEYISFIDPDDTVTPAALEELYSAAQKFEADVVHCEKWYQIPDEFFHDAEHRKNLKPYSWPMGEKIFITEPTLLTNDLEKRITDFSKKWLSWSVWAQLIRRDFIIENEIKMPCTVTQDMIFTMCELCSAEKYLVIPKIVNYYRQRSNSISKERIEVQKTFHKYIVTLKRGIKYLDKFLGDREFFLRYPDLKYILFNTFAQEILRHFNEIYAQISPHVLNEILQKEFGANSAFEAFIFNMMNVQRLQSMQRQYQFNQFAAQARQRIAELENELRRRSQ